MHDTLTGVTSPLPWLRGVPKIEYSDDLLLTHDFPWKLRLRNLRTTPPGEVLITAYGERQLALDGYIAAWVEDPDLRAMAQDVRDFFPAYQLSDARYLNGLAPRSFTPARGPWLPRFYVTRDVDWTIDISFRLGPVRRLTGHSSHGEITPGWDGRDRAGRHVQTGVIYTWQLSGTAVDGKPLRNGNGTSTIAAHGTLLADLWPPIGHPRPWPSPEESQPLPSEPAG